jgi:hypothetical protein
MGVVAFDHALAHKHLSHERLLLYYQIRLGEAKRKKGRLRNENVNPIFKRFEQSAAVELFERLEPAEIAGVATATVA